MRWRRARTRARASPFEENALKDALLSSEFSTNDSANRAFAVGVCLINAGFLEDGRRAIHLVAKLVNEEGIDYSPSGPASSLHERSLRFVSEVAPTTAPDQSLANVLSSPEVLDQEEIRQRKYWSEDLFRDYGTIDRRTWRERVEPLDTLRCAYLYICPPRVDTLPSPNNELEGLEALRKFIDDSADKPHITYHFRRAQAIACAIEIAAKHGKSDIAFSLATEAAKNPDYLQSGYACSFTLCRHFLPMLLETASSSSRTSSNSSPHQANLAEIRKSLGVDAVKAQKLPQFIASELQKRFETDRRVNLKTLTGLNLLRELDKVSRLSSRRLDEPMKESRSTGIRFRDGVRDWQFTEVEKRLRTSLPSDYKSLMRASDGWDGSNMGYPVFASLDAISFVDLKTPIPITDPNLPGKYDTSITVTRGLRLDPGPIYDPNQDPSQGPFDMLLIIECPRLKPPPAKRVKGNDGKAIETRKIDLRLVRWRSGLPPVYFYSVLEYLYEQIRACDDVLGVTRDAGSEENDDSDGDEGEEEGYGRGVSELVEHADDGGDSESEDGGSASSAPKDLPACWYGRECRTQHHNSSHASRFDHTGPNLRPN